ncbi:hypothetical protein SGPA1_12203 [Streptomyces misionensis JCM 4497]
MGRAAGRGPGRVLRGRRLSRPPLLPTSRLPREPAHRLMSS